MQFNFERLEIWQKSRELVNRVYIIISQFPSNERYALSDQLRRAVISVASNIAEGSGRISTKEKIHFIEIAYGSLMEVTCQLILASDLGIIKEDELLDIRIIIEELGCQLSAFRRVLSNRLSQQ